ncbi:MAG: hypothetical protein ACRDOB_06125, partial [Streptosporangiaceae bacterium]
MTRDPADNARAGDAWGPRGPAGRRRPRAAAPESGQAGFTPPRPAAPFPTAPFPAAQFPAAQFPAGDRDWGPVPGYEFEGRRSPSGPQPRPAGAETGPARAAHRGRAGWHETGDQPRRFRYSPTTSGPQPVPPPSRPRSAPVRPGFEFDTAAQTTPTAGTDWTADWTGPTAQADWTADWTGPTAQADWTAQMTPAAGPLSRDPFSPGLFSSDHFNAPQARTHRPGPTAPDEPRTRRKARRAEPPEGTEWTRLLRSFVPEPAKLTWFKQFRSALEFRGLALRVAVPIVTMIVFGVAVVVMAEANSGAHPGQTPPPAALGFPPATLAGSEFTAAASGRGISQTLGRVVSDGAEIVAVGSQDGTRIARAQFFVSADNGATWAMGAVRTPAGGPPPPGYAARFVAGGHGAWVALGPDSIWTSPDGRTWTLASTTGLPLRPGDQISVLKRTAAGFVAAGANVPDASVPGGSSPVVFLSANGITWQRLGAQQLRLAAGTARVEGIGYAAAYGGRILIAGGVSMTTGPPGHTRTVQAGAAWLSTDGGTTWALAVPPAVTPAGPGAQPLISGEAVTGQGFVLLRPATAAGQAGSKAPGKARGKAVGKARGKADSKADTTTATEPAVDVYHSPNGTAWTYAATLTTPAGFTVGMANGSQTGAVITGQAGPALTAFTSADGASWRQDPAFGTAAAEDVSGVALTSNGTAVAAGTTVGDPDSRQPLLTLLSPNATPSQVAITKIPGAVHAELAVNSVAAGNGAQVAVGSANGYPAAWSTVDGGSSWRPAAGQTPAVLDRPGIQQLTSVT